MPFYIPENRREDASEYIRERRDDEKKFVKEIESRIKKADIKNPTWDDALRAILGQI